MEPPGLHVVHVAVEMAPICKVGGLGDVVTALGRAVQEQGHTVEVILPRQVLLQPSAIPDASVQALCCTERLHAYGKEIKICQCKEREDAVMIRHLYYLPAAITAGQSSSPSSPQVLGRVGMVDAILPDTQRSIVTLHGCRAAFSEASLFLK